MSASRSQDSTSSRRSRQQVDDDNESFNEHPARSRSSRPFQQESSSSSSDDDESYNERRFRSKSPLVRNNLMNPPINSGTVLAAEIAMKYHALASYLKQTAHDNHKEATMEYNTAQSNLSSTYKKSQQNVDRARAVMASANSIFEKAVTEEKESRAYLEYKGETHYIAAKFHAAATSRLEAATLTRAEAYREFRTSRDELEYNIRQSQERYEVATVTKECTKKELMKAWQEVMHSRKYLRELGLT